MSGTPEPHGPLSVRDRPSPASSRLRTVGAVVLCYAFWIANGALGLVTAGELRAAMDRVGLVLGWNPYGFTLADEVELVVLGLAWLVWVVFTESWYRTGLGRSVATLLRRVLRTSAILVALLVLCGLEALLLRL